MTDQHPITPPQWQVDAWCKQALAMGADVDTVFLEAARWGADQELEACCNWLNWLPKLPPWSGNYLRKHRRPKPPTLKEQGLKALDSFEGFTDSLEEVNIIRRALEALDD